MWFITFIFANLVGRPARTLLTLTGIAIAVAAVVALLGVVRGFEKSLLDLYQGRGIDIMVQQAGRLQMTSSVLPESLGASIAAVDGIAAVHPALFEVLSLIEDDMVGVVIQGWPPDSEPIRRLDWVDGGPFTLPDARQVMVGTRLAAALNVKVGDKTDLLDGEAFEVVGIFESNNVFDSGAMFAPLQSLQDLMLREDEVTLFAVVAKDQKLDALRDLASRIQTAAPKIEASVADDVAQRSSEIRVARSFAWLTSAIALMIGSVGMLNTMMMAVFERTREIAMLRALGWKRRRVIAMILGESTLISLVAAMIGIVLAIVVVQVLSQMPAA
ncbi:MAG TPA: ABC transporter permease, partial [Planctomycetaceae bacterium]|nr:ABC transporter permease [Planctomycetaceae bacterium]